MIRLHSTNETWLGPPDERDVGDAIRAPERASVRSTGATRVVSSETGFPVGGETIAATWYQPEARHGPLPCVVMGHGFTLTRRDGIPQYAQRLAAGGFAVLAFDYRHWGDSTGQPRRWFSLRKQLIDWQMVVEYARSMDSIDADRVVVWGMSMGGGYALLTAARDSRIAAVVALVPVTDPLAAQVRPAMGMRMIGRALRETLTRRPVRMPVAGPPGSFALVAAPEAIPGFERLTVGHDWHNEINTGWLLAAARWRPVREATEIQAPILLQLAERDGAVPLPAIERTAARAPRAELKRYDLDHFSCFWGENITQLATHQIDFLRRHLLKPRQETHVNK